METCFHSSVGWNLTETIFKNPPQGRFLWPEAQKLLQDAHKHTHTELIVSCFRNELVSSTGAKRIQVNHVISTFGLLRPPTFAWKGYKLNSFLDTFIKANSCQVLRILRMNLAAFCAIVFI